MIPFPSHFDFFHDYFFKTLFYLFIFLMWMIWVEKFLHRKEKIKNSRINDFNSGISYELYTRKKWGNNDLCTIVPFKDMEPFIEFKLNFLTTEN
jgi:hypothetical protein